MLAHQIKSDCDRRRPAVDEAESRLGEKSMSPEERSMGQEEERQLADSPSISHDSSGTQLGYETSQSHEAAGHQEDVRRRQKSAPGTDKISSGLTGKPMLGVEARLLVRRREAGALIGKRGANIKRLRQIFKESAFNIPDTGNGPERVVCINTCSLDELSVILTELTQLFQEKQQNHSFRSYPPSSSCPAEQSAARTSELIELKLLVNASHAGLLIGIGGQSIRKLRSDSRAAIKIYEMCCPLSSERVCAIKAKPPVVVSTIRMILEILATNSIKGTHKPYDALNFDLFLADKYGGYAPDDEPNLSISSPPPATQATVPLDILQQLHQMNSHSSMTPQSALILQNQAAQLLAAAAAATAAASSRAGTAASDYLDSQPPRLSPSYVTRMLARTPASCDRFTAAATLAAEKYRSIMKAGQQAAIASRYHPYQEHVQLRGHHNQSAATERHRAIHEQQNYTYRKSDVHGLTCSCCQAGAEAQRKPSAPSEAGKSSDPNKEPLA